MRYPVGCNCSLLDSEAETQHILTVKYRRLVNELGLFLPQIFFSVRICKRFLGFCLSRGEISLRRHIVELLVIAGLKVGSRLNCI